MEISKEFIDKEVALFNKESGENHVRRRQGILKGWDAQFVFLANKDIDKDEMVPLATIVRIELLGGVGA